jgi:hypothetical protein
MDADLGLLLIAVHCTAHYLLPVQTQVARRVGLLFPRLIQRPGFVKRRLLLSDTIEALIAEFARHSPGFEDERDAFTAPTGYDPPPRVDGIELRDRVWLDLGISNGAAGQSEAHCRPELGVGEPDSPAVGLDDRP